MSSTPITEFYSPYTGLAPIPNDLTIPQFFLDHSHPARPLRPENSPWFIDNDSGRTFGYELLRSRTYGLANALSSRWNVVEGDVVAIFSPNHVDFPVAVWSAHRLGAIITAANPAFSVEELASQLLTAKASLLFAHSSVIDIAKAAARSSGIPEYRIILITPVSGPAYGTDHNLLTVGDAIAEGLIIDPAFVERKLNPGEAKTKIAFYNFSSGTTGKPKAVSISHYSIIANVLQMAAMYRLNDPLVPLAIQRWRPGDISLNILPLFHIFGLVLNLHHMLFCGCSVVIVSKFNFQGMLDSIVKYRVANLFLAPPMIVMLCKNPKTLDYDLSSLRNIMVGAAPVSSELTKQLVKLVPSCNIFQGYGLTETATTVTMGPLTQKISTLGAAGRLIPGIVARILKEDGSYGKFGERGELVVKSPSNALCYSNNEEATKETFIDGWVRTGDEAIVNEKYEVFIVDRLKEMIKVRGYQVAPAELEGHLLDHPFVSDVCVVGVPDEYSGELPFAFVVPHATVVKMMEKGEGEIAKIKAAIEKHVSDVKVPYKRLAGGIEFIDAIPKNPSGKLLRRLLRDQAKAARAKMVVEQKSVKTKM